MRALIFGGALAALACSDAPSTLATASSSIVPPALRDAGGVVGDVTRGEAVYGRCLACHSLEMDRTGPRHCGVVGRRAGSVAGFAYSDAMKRSGIVWDAASLDRFLAAPMSVVPGTAMTWAGIADAQERADVIAFLAQKGASCE